MRVGRPRAGGWGLAVLHLLPRPSSLPHLQTLVDDIGSPSSKALAKALGVSERTVRRWMRAGQAPRVVLLALFWVSRWGRSALDVELQHDAMLYRALARSLEKERDDLRHRLQRLGSIGEFGSANDPDTGAPSVRPPSSNPSRSGRGGRAAAGALAADLDEIDRRGQRTRERNARRLRREAWEHKRGRFDREDAA